MKKKDRPRLGTCKLTLQAGAFVESHLIPNAFTKPQRKGASLIQMGSGTRPIRRWSGWYDANLVTAEGERILEEIDAWAIAELRKHKLVWSGWGVDRTLGPHHTPIENSQKGVRNVEGIDTAKLRLFFLSLLWRAAATELSEFKDISLPEADLEMLRIMLVNRSAQPLNLYPIQLTQLSTIGLIHNHTPIADEKFVPMTDPDSPWSPTPIYRFYFDGLVAHLHRFAFSDKQLRERGNLLVGWSSDLIVSTQTYEGSLQREIVSESMEDGGRAQWPWDAPK